MKSRQFNVLGNRVTLLVLLITTFFSLITLILIGFNNYQQEIRNIDTRISEIENGQLTTLQDAVWLLNKTQIEEQLNSLSRLQHMAQVKLILPERTIFVGQMEKDIFREVKFSLKNERWGILGTLHLSFSKESIYNQIFSDLKTAALYLIAPLILSVFSVSLIFWLIITRRLYDLLAFIQSLNVNNLDSDFSFRKLLFRNGKKDELDQLLSAINEMRYQVNTEMQNRLLTEDKLRESRNNYRMLFDNTPETQFIHDGETGRILDVNQEVFSMFGYTKEEALKLSIEDLTYVDDEHNLKQAIKELHKTLVTGKNLIEWPAKKKMGQMFWVEINMSTFTQNNKKYILASVRDINENKNSEEKIRHYQKMDTIGQMAGGVAHDFNNILTGILGAAELLSPLLKRPKEQKFLKIIQGSAGRASGITQKLLSFTRLSRQNYTPQNVIPILENCIDLLDHTIDKKIRIIKNFKADNTNVMGDAGDLQNIFLNLGINGAQAIKKTGEIEFSCKNIYLDSAFFHRNALPDDKGDFIQISIRDTGSGIPKDIQNRIFEPFFTTKEHEKGTGLGLSTVYGLVGQHKGYLLLYSEINMGTVFHVYLPLLERNTNEKESENNSEKQDVKTGSILLIDDESSIRETVSEILKNIGYIVYTASNGKEGLEIYQRKSSEIQVIILDMIMPIMDGRECFHEILKVNPLARIILASGFTHEEHLEELRKKGSFHFIPKPYSTEQISTIVHQMMPDK